MRTIRLPLAIAGCLCGLAALPAGGGSGGAARAWAAVIVIDNRTPDEVRFSVQVPGAKGTDYRLQPGQVLPLHVEEKISAAFVSEGVARRKPLELNAIYSFQALPGGVDLERTKFPRKAQRQPPLEPARLPHLGAGRAAPDFGPSEVIGIKILVDEEQKATRQKWEADLRRAIKAASDVIQRHCGLRFEIQSIDAWQSDDRAPGSGQLLADFQKKVDPRPAWLAIGFTSQQRAVRGQAERHPAQIFASHILFRDWKGRIDEAERVEQLVHALGHWLGAVDSPDPTSVMRPPSGDFRARAQKFPLQFDAPNTLLLNVVADQIRREGPAAWPDLPNRLRQQVAAVWTLIDGQAQQAAPPRRPAVAKTRPAPKGRYSALLVDGTKLSGETVRDWGRKADNPRLDEQSLFDPAHPVRWLRDEQQDVPGTPAAFVEMVGGDRLPGKVVRYVPADDGTSPGAEESGGGARSLPAHLVVEPEPGSVLRFAGERPTIHVRAAWLRRIVWQRVGDERYEPNAVRLRSGGAIRFRSLQFAEAGVKLLVDEGVEQHPFAEIGEIHLPTIDPWAAWYQQLAVLSPDGRGRLVRWETSDGLRVMSSAERFRAFDGPGDRADGWIHMAQPAWSLTPLFVRHLSIRLRTWFEPGEFPLSALDPVTSRREAIFGSAWDWRADQNCRGGALRCGREEFAWGLGVQATSELSFDLPALATGLRTRVGLDRLAGRGGCAGLKSCSRPGPMRHAAGPNRRHPAAGRRRCFAASCCWVRARIRTPACWLSPRRALHRPAPDGG